MLEDPERRSRGSGPPTSALVSEVYAPWQPSNEGQERTDPSAYWRLGHVVIGPE